MHYPKGHYIQRLNSRRERKSNIASPSSISQMGPKDNYPGLAVQSIRFFSIINVIVAVEA